MGSDIALVEGDILDAAACVLAADGCETVIHLATAIPRGPNPDWSLNDRIRAEGTANLLAAALSAGARRYVQQSIIFLYRSGGDEWLDEESPLDPLPHLRSAAEMEAMVRASDNIEWVILRGGAFYGRGTGTTERLLQAVREGTASVSAESDGYISLIHTSDMASAVVAAVDHAPARTVYNVVDNEPVRHRDLVRYLANLVGGPHPSITTGSVGAGRRSLRVSNARLRAALGWRPTFSTYREGYGEILAGNTQDHWPAGWGGGGL